MHLHGSASGRGAHSTVIRTPGYLLVSSSRGCSYGCAGSEMTWMMGDNGSKMVVAGSSEVTCIVSTNPGRDGVTQSA